jgi:hypothetical protein
MDYGGVGMIVYKVVTTDRKSVSTLVAKSKLFKTYRKGEIVTADDGTFGLFCFKSFAAAKVSSYEWSRYGNSGTLVLACKTIGKRCKLSEKVVNLEITKLTKKTALADFREGYDYYVPSKETVCYNQLKVLD